MQANSLPSADSLISHFSLEVISPLSPSEKDKDVSLFSLCDTEPCLAVLECEQLTQAKPVIPVLQEFGVRLFTASHYTVRALRKHTEKFSKSMFGERGTDEEWFPRRSEI